MYALYNLIQTVLELYLWIILITVIMSWLIMFQVVNMQNGVVRQIYSVLYQLTEPVLRPIRRLLPDMGGLDLSPLVAGLAIIFAQNLLFEYWPRG